MAGVGPRDHAPSQTVVAGAGSAGVETAKRLSAELHLMAVQIGERTAMV